MKAKARKTPSQPPTRPAQVPTYSEISAEAEVLWRQRGCPSGVDEEIWLQAERQLHLFARMEKGEEQKTALADPLSRLDHRSDDVMGELEQLFPGSADGASTSV